MASPLLRVGVMGCAGIARKNVAALAELHSSTGAARVVAVASRTLSKAAAFVKDNGMDAAQVDTVEGYDELLARKDVDAVYLPLPTSMHVEWAIKAAAAGKHVLLEKPISTTDDESQRILKACTAANVALLDGTMFQHDARWAKVITTVQDEATFGPLSHFHGVFTFAGDASFFKDNIRVKSDLDSLGCLGDVGWYPVRAALRVFGDAAPLSVTGHGGAVRNDAGVLLRCGATMAFEGGGGLAAGGRTAVIECAFDRVRTERVSVSSASSAVSMDDAFIPFEASEASFDLLTTSDGDRGDRKVTRVTVGTPLSQEACMWRAFARMCGDPRGEEARMARRRADQTQRVVLAISRSLASTPPATVEVDYSGLP